MYFQISKSNLKRNLDLMYFRSSVNYKYLIIVEVHEDAVPCSPCSNKCGNKCSINVEILLW